MSEKEGKGIKSSPKSKDGGKNGNSTRLEKGRKFEFDPKEQEAWVLALPFSQVIPKGKRSMKKRCKRVREDDENAETDDDDDDDDMTIAERFNISSTVDCYDDDDDTVLVKIVPLSQVLEKLDDRTMNKRAREDDENAETDDDDNMTIAERFRSRKKRSDVVSAKGEKSSLEVNNKVSDSAKGERSGLVEVVNNVSDLPKKLAFGDETVATHEIEQKNDENKTSKPSNGVVETQEEDDVVVNETVATQETEQKNDENNTSSGVAEQQEDDVVAVDERLKQRKLAIWELALKLEERILKVENTLAKIKQWKLRQSQTTPPASA